MRGTLTSRMKRTKTRSNKYLVIFNLAVLCQLGVHSQHDFESEIDEQQCKDTKLVEISPYRSVSTISLSWKSSAACCKLNGRILHTIERNDESQFFPLREVLSEAFIKENSEATQDLQFWIGARIQKRHSARYQWSYGTDVQNTNYKLTIDQYKWAQDVGNPRRNPACVLMRPSAKILELQPERCVRRSKFICQKVDQRGGTPLRGIDAMTVGSTEFLDIPGFDRLKFSTVPARWSVANAMCRTNNWTLIDHVHDCYGESLIREIISNRSTFVFDKNINTIQTGGNDFRHPYNWDWPCGEHSLQLPLHKNCTNVDTSENSLYHHHSDRCLHFILPPENDTQGLPLLMAQSVDCDEIGYVICDTRPACNADKQYKALQLEPNYYDVDEGIEKEMEECSNSKFLIKTPSFKKDVLTYWITSTQFTWKGAERCCHSRGWSLPRPDTNEELSVLDSTSFETISSICADNACDGIWSGATTIGQATYSVLKFPNGDPVLHSLISHVRADSYAYPSCGRINYISWGKTDVKYMYAHCLEKNFLVCQEIDEEATARKARSFLAPSVGSGSELGKVKSNGSAEFDRKKLAKFLEPPTLEDKGRVIWDKKRDSCADVKIDKKYKRQCRSSSTSLSPNIKPATSKTEEDLINAHLIVGRQNRILLEELLTSTIKSTPHKNGEFPYAFQLLNYAATLYAQLCPLVPVRFITRAIRLFHELRSTWHPKRKGEMMTKSNLKWTMKMLDKCLELVKPVRLMNDPCGEMIVAQNCNCSDFICTKAKFESKLYKADLLMDIVWKVFEAAYSVCFPAFRENVLLHHKFAMTIVDLWDNKDMRIRWSNQIEGEHFWLHLLGPSFSIHLVNMERCNEANIKSAYYPIRLSPSSLPVTARIAGVSYGKNS